MNRIFFLLATLAASMSAAAIARAGDDIPTYTIYRSGGPIAIDGRLDEAAWRAAPTVGPFRFPWHSAGEKEQTAARLLWDEENLYVSFRCDDAHVWGRFTGRDETVYRDDCVELFTAPNPQWIEQYFNFEMNVRGALLDHYHPEGPGSGGKNHRWNSQGTRIAVYIAGTLNDDGDSDDHWVLEAAIPLANFAGVALHVPPRDGDVWRLNLNRLGGETNPQHSQWSPSDSPKPAFHLPGSFGRVIFSSSQTTSSQRGRRRLFRRR